MVKIRLAQMGRKKRHSYRIVVIDSKAKRDGKYIERIGFYNPYENATKPVFDKERYDYWVNVGAQPSNSVYKLIKGTYTFKFANSVETEIPENENKTESGEKSE